MTWRRDELLRAEGKKPPTGALALSTWERTVCGSADEAVGMLCWLAERAIYVSTPG